MSAAAMLLETSEFLARPVLLCFPDIFVLVLVLDAAQIVVAVAVAIAVDAAAVEVCASNSPV